MASGRSRLARAEATSDSTEVTPPVNVAAPGIYVHIPFCARICPYCDFAVTTAPEKAHNAFFESVGTELDMVRARWLGATERVGPADTLYFGGGTPSLVSERFVEALVATLVESEVISTDCALFLEANPEDVRRDRLASWNKIGVTTLSLGVQALDDDALAFLGRRHSAAEARSAVATAKDCIERVSIDLIYGMSGQSLQDWREQLDQAIELRPHHLSCYQLTLHDGTAFGARAKRGEMLTASHEDEAEMFRLTHQILEDAGYIGYEVSNFARGDSYRSEHNQKYWQHTPYLGLGPGAHSFDGNRYRSWNVSAFSDWRERLGAGGLPLDGEERLSVEQLKLEFLMLRMRTRDGLNLSGFTRRFGEDLAQTKNLPLMDYARQGLLQRNGEHLSPTLSGLAVADQLATQLSFSDREGAGECP